MNIKKGGWLYRIANIGVLQPREIENLSSFSFVIRLIWMISFGWIVNLLIFVLSLMLLILLQIIYPILYGDKITGWRLIDGRIFFPVTAPIDWFWWPKYRGIPLGLFLVIYNLVMFVKRQIKNRTSSINIVD